MFLKSQKNLLSTAIREHGFSLRDFSLKEATEMRITHIKSGYYYRIYTVEIPIGSTSNRETRLQSLFTPDFKAAIPTKAETRPLSVKTWADLLKLFNDWLAWLKYETEKPDLWAEMEYTPYMFADEEPVTEEQFTTAEVKLLEERVIEVERRVLALNLPPEAEAAVVATVREVPGKAKRFTKKELADCIVGSLVKEGFKWGLTTEHMSAAWHACQHFFTLLLT